MASVHPHHDHIETVQVAFVGLLTLGVVWIVTMLRACSAILSNAR